MKKDIDCADLESLARQISTIGGLASPDQESVFIDQCLSAKPGSAKLHIAAGRYYLDSCHYKLAEAQFCSANRIEPNNPVPLLQLGFMEICRQRFLNAARYFEMAVTRQPDNAILYFHLANVLMRTGRPDSAMITCNKGLLIDAENSKLNGLKSRLLVDLGEVDEAWQHCHDLVLGNPDEPAYLAQLAEIESLRGNREAALRCFYLSVWKRLLNSPDYTRQLMDAIASIGDAQESCALQSRVNRELGKLAQHVQDTVESSIESRANTVSMDTNI